MKKGFAVTIGFFDGVHQGHRYLLRQLQELAEAKDLQPAAVTFDCHPRTIVQEDYVPSLLTTQEEKLKLLSEAFKGEIFVLPFTQELSVMTAKDFMQNILRDKLNAELLLMGYNHRHPGTTANYRIDRMDHVEVVEKSELTEEAIAKIEEVGEYTQQVFKMFGGELQGVVLHFDKFVIHANWFIESGSFFVELGHGADISSTIHQNIINISKTLFHRLESFNHKINCHNLSFSFILCVV